MCSGAELYFQKVQPSDAGVYVCTCRDQRSSNRSRAEIVVTSEFQSHRRLSSHSHGQIFFLQFLESIHIIADTEEESRSSSAVKTSLMHFNELAITGVQYLADGAYSAVYLFNFFFFFQLPIFFASVKTVSRVKTNVISALLCSC